ncbi:MAG TPA: hypothetical protein VFD73_17620 [Gemmatimonadales bacterium]|nr:hypothetical protein [Gemmatimonadales bacterium]
MTQSAIEQATPLCGPHVRYARMEGVTMAEWLTKAVETEAQKQEGNQVIPPGRPRETSLPSPTIELHDAASALQAVAVAAQAGLPVTKAAVRDTVGLIREQVRVCRGLPMRQTSRPIGQTRRLDHETPEMEPLVPGDAADAVVPEPVTRNGAGDSPEA